MIRVRLFGVVRLKSGTKEVASDAKDLRELRRQIPGLTERECKDCLVMVNGVPAKGNVRFDEGDEVVLMSPAGGG